MRILWRMHIPRRQGLDRATQRRVVDLAIDRMWQSPATIGALLFDAALLLLGMSLLAAGVLAWAFDVGAATWIGLGAFGLAAMGFVLFHQHRRRGEYIGNALRELGHPIHHGDH